MRAKEFPDGTPPETGAGVATGPGAAAEPPPPRSGLAIRPKFIGLEVFWATYARVEMRRQRKYIGIWLTSCLLQSLFH
jgi:hypothetical protein